MSDELRVDGAGRLVDPAFLVNANPEEVLGLMDAASGSAERLAAAVYRASAHLHRDAKTGMRRQLLAVDAARYGDRALSARISAVPVKEEPAAQWSVEWATGTMVDHRFGHTRTGHTSMVDGVATATVEGCAVAITSSLDGEARVWELATGRQIGEPGIRALVNGTATAVVVEGRMVAVIGSDEGEVRMWDWATGDQVGRPLTGHTGTVWEVATAVVEGRPVAVTGSFDGEVRVWDLATSRQIGEPLTVHTDGVLSLAATVVEGDLLAVTGSTIGEARAWNLTTRQQIGEPLTGHTHDVYAAALEELEGRAVAVTGSDDRTVRVWNLATGQQIGRELVFPAPVGAVAVTSNDRLVVGFGNEVAVLARR